MRTLVIAVDQTRPVPGDPDASFKEYAGRIRAIHETFPQVQLVLHPELHLSAPAGLLDEPAAYARHVAVDIPGPLTEQLAGLARETKLWLAPGSVYEQGAGDAVYNTAIVVAPTGELAARYRKCFPWQPYERTTPGSEPVTFDMPLPGAGTARIGLAICYDGAFPEIFRQLAWSGADVVLQPTLTPTRDRELELVLARSNAAVNQIYVINANASDPSAVGESVIVDPEGHIRQHAGHGTDILIDALDLDAVTRVRTYGTYGLNRPWDEWDRIAPALTLPMYGKLNPRPR